MARPPRLVADGLARARAQARADGDRSGEPGLQRHAGGGAPRRRAADRRAMSGELLREAYVHCGQLAREHERDRWLSALFAPEAAAPASACARRLLPRDRPRPACGARAAGGRDAADLVARGHRGRARGRGVEPTRSPPRSVDTIARAGAAVAERSRTICWGGATNSIASRQPPRPRSKPSGATCSPPNSGCPRSRSRGPRTLSPRALRPARRRRYSRLAAWRTSRWPSLMRPPPRWRYARCPPKSRLPSPRSPASAWT